MNRSKSTWNLSTTQLLASFKMFLFLKQLHLHLHLPLISLLLLLFCYFTSSSSSDVIHSLGQHLFWVYICFCYLCFFFSFLFFVYVLLFHLFQPILIKLPPPSPPFFTLHTSFCFSFFLISNFPRDHVFFFFRSNLFRYCI